mmetsp:Transcript_6915/g.15203  ORF Transcript_6915/g.15203 Transcript_6915/m.15203 type:complete len:352 (+) Transcript_6915:185-1240(+)
MACVPLGERHHHDNAVISFNTIGNNSILHHAPHPPPGTPRATPRATPKTINPKKTTPSIDGYTIYVDDDEEAKAKTSATRISCGQCLSNFGNWYSDQINRNPVRTKSLTAGALAVVGDVLAQIIENSTDLRMGSTGVFDKRRIFAMFIEGSCVSGPMLHFVFEWYEYLFPIHCLDGGSTEDSEIDEDNDEHSIGLETSSSNKPVAEYVMSRRMYFNAFLHVLFDQVVMAFPYVAGMMIVTGVVEGHGSTLAEELENEYMNNVHASWYAAMGLAPIQFITFRFLPITLRVLAVNLIDVIWVMFMSYSTHRTREVSEPFFEPNDDDWYDHDDLFSTHEQSEFDTYEQNQDNLE